MAFVPRAARSRSTASASGASGTAGSRSSPKPRASISPASAAGARATSAVAAPHEHHPVVGDQRRAAPDQRQRQRRLAGPEAPRISTPRPAKRHRRAVQTIVDVCRARASLARRPPSFRFGRDAKATERRSQQARTPGATDFLAAERRLNPICRGRKPARSCYRSGTADAAPRQRPVISQVPARSGDRYRGGMQRMTTVFKVQDEVNPRMTLEATGFPGVARVHYNLLEPALVQAAVARGEGDLGQGGALPRLHRPPHRPQPQGQVRRPRALGRAARLVGEQRPDDAGALRAAARRHARPHPRRRALRAGPLRRRRPGLPAERPRDHRARLARPLHPPPAAPPGPGRAGRLRARLHHPQLPELPGRPGPPRLPLRDGDRHLLRAAADPDRRHRLRRREQEVGLHRAQLPAARAAG